MDYVPKTHWEIKQLAVDLLAGVVYTGSMCPGPTELRLMFLPLGFADEEIIENMKKENIVFFYEHLKNSLVSIDGKPSFGSVNMLNQTDYDRLIQTIEKVKAVMAAPECPQGKECI